MIFTLPALPYAYNGLVPYIDAQTMEIHHTKHHQTYVDKLNQALAGTAIATAQGTEPSVLAHLLKDISAYHTAVRNNAGGHFNHSFFWNSLIPNSVQAPGAALLRVLENSFGSFEKFKETFTAAAAGHFGSGWAWLSVAKKDGSLFISTTNNQDNPLMNTTPVQEQGLPILGLDLWEHAYYLLYQNKRPAYIEAFWKIIHWEEVERRYMRAVQ
ncbi:MAG: superoxide dismutase [Candidatus Cardinium sp.]|uniref:superoxide dismutase n=1 Tax=Cardinium endosymbiont of Dermatophagoides farinae TaxID=2597823 RepID=UPI0011838906|nr:superoxide dismutase [Cardinium endosymbiont of Dermatophagoides farinae]TSJ80622.1 superoxide dismutase [Cardinium endosymbiont of Dermatophagoides farinae]UWW96615.1 MAG: superoxide dismutase [Candidatus Cardinium sp.]